jgi:hypothetical protein
MVCAPAAVRSFLRSSEEYILAIGQARVKHMIHNTRRCVHLTEIGAIVMDVSENEILFLHYYHINQPFLRRQLISILTDRQTDRRIRDWCEALYPYRSNVVLHPLTLCSDVVIP